MDEYSCCELCPRGCKINRYEHIGGCGVGASVMCARAALHFGEEPCISGENGSGTVFFSGCQLHCIYCQNMDISCGKLGYELTDEGLCDIFLNLQSQGANNINLVSGTQYLPHIKKALQGAKQNGLRIPIVYNSGGYERTDSLAELSGLVDIFLPDLKTLDTKTAKHFYNNENYPRVATEAIKQMYKMVGAPRFDDRGIMTNGVIVRHLVLPDHVEDSFDVLDLLFDTFGNEIYVSIMSQYTPMGKELPYAELNRTLRADEYKRVVDYAWGLGMENCFIQDGEAVGKSYIPEFDGTGIIQS